MSEYTEIRSRDGNQVFRLRYNNKALRWFERQTGLKFMSIDPNNLGLDEVSHLAAAGLIHENPDITIDDADDFIDTVGLQRAFRAVMEAVEHDLGGDLDEPEPMNGTDPKNATGAGSKQR